MTAALPTRVRLVSVDRSILSSYDGTASRAPIALWTLASGKATPDTAAALLALAHAVEAAGAVFRVTDLYRDSATQAAARARYDRWVANGKRQPPGAGEKADFVAMPGHSNHGAGRAADLGVKFMRFPGVAADRQLDTLWEIARPLGWTPILKTATEGASESWHFDFLGPWAHVLPRLGYSATAMCGHLDLGSALYGDDLDRWRQAQLHRAGYDVGVIDGAIGAKTREGARRAGVDIDDLAALAALPDAGEYVA